MGIQCNKCGSRNTQVVKAKEMAEKTGDNSFMTATSGAVDPNIVLKALEALFNFLGKLFESKSEAEKNNGSVLVCKDCGAWERI